MCKKVYRVVFLQNIHNRKKVTVPSNHVLGKRKRKEKQIEHGLDYGGRKRGSNG